MRLMTGEFAAYGTCNIQRTRNLKNLSTSKLKGSRLRGLFSIFNNRAGPCHTTGAAVSYGTEARTEA